MQPGQNEVGSRAVQPDFEALSALLRTHGPGVGRDLASQFGRHLQRFLDIDDVMQVTYLEAFLQFSHFVPRGGGSFKAWLKQIARNNLRDAIRELRRSRRKQLPSRLQPASSNGWESSFAADVAAGSATPSREAAGRERAEVLRTVITRLPRDYRRVVQLCDLEGKTVPQAAVILRRSKGAVHMLRARAHDRLRLLLGSQSRFYTDGDSA